MSVSPAIVAKPLMLRKTWICFPVKLACERSTAKGDPVIIRAGLSVINPEERACTVWSGRATERRSIVEMIIAILFLLCFNDFRRTYHGGTT
jgi:hypothetical protein